MKSGVASLLLRPWGIMAAGEISRVKDCVMRIVKVVMVVRLVTCPSSGSGGDRRVVTLPRPTSLNKFDLHMKAALIMKSTLLALSSRCRWSMCSDGVPLEYHVELTLDGCSAS